MPLRHFFLALLVVSIWGCNFIFIKLSLLEISPLLLCAIRFFLASFPAILFIKFPKIYKKQIILYGLVMFGLQFSLLFLGMRAGMTPGLTALLMQVQIFFSLFFAAAILDEKPTIGQIIAALVSFAGIGLISMHLDSSISLPGFILIIAAAASWGAGNLITKKNSHINFIALVVWGSFVACWPLFFLSLIFEGPTTIKNSIHNVSWIGGLSVLYIVYASTWIGYGVWNKLLSMYPVVTIVPFTLMVPIFGMLSSIIFSDESLEMWKLYAALLIISGLGINLLITRFSFQEKK